MDLADLERRYKQATTPQEKHVVVAHYLLKELAERQERLVLFCIAQKSREQPVNFDSLPGLMPHFTQRGGCSTDWIGKSCNKLKELGFIRLQEGQGYVLTAEASLLRDWLDESVWEKDDILGLGEWVDPQALVVTP